jgi:two-component system, chemotaxis family, chemotaxis protein CheY
MARILAVDDSETIQNLVRQVLTKGNHQVEIATDGEDGLKKFQSSMFQLVITDINMPRMNGLELIEQIRLSNQTVPILALTSENEKKFRDQGATAGANGWIVKPFRPAQLLDIVGQII